jgi:uncharacterized protein (TIGR02001 family)
MKTKILIPALVLSAAAAVPATSMAGTASANIGWSSDYIFRGIHQNKSSAYAGVDYATDSGFYIGNWDADVGKGLENDLYFGYAGGEDFTYKIGYTGYYYTDDFDDTYNEINLGLYYGIFSLDVAVGKWDGFGNKQDYTFTSITIQPQKGPYYKIGGFSQDFSGSYFELGYTTHLKDLDVDLNFAWDHSSDLNVSSSGNADNAIVFGIKKTFALGGKK